MRSRPDAPIRSSRAQLTAASVALLLASACGAATRRFADRPILWDDDDRRTFAPPPAHREEAVLWDAMDGLLFRPASEVWTFQPRREALNVNALDEVADSSWFENRLSRHPMSPEETARGACPSDVLDVPAPWRIFAAKPDGATPGFLFADASGVRYVLKVDRANQPEQCTAADAIVASIYHAAGYFVPCNRVVGFTRDMLEIDPESTGASSISWEHIEPVLETAQRMPDGRYRAVVSRFVEGEPLGPWHHMGVREDDPNDVIPHEARRELRGLFVLDAWVNHWDARNQNTLATWIEPRGDGAGYVRHYLVDFGDTLGEIQGDLRRARRYGYSQFFDVQHAVEDWATFGLLQRPWDGATMGRAGIVLGYFRSEGFAPDQWRPNHWNGALERHTERDAAWMARIIARISRAHVEALVELGHYRDPIVSAELERILLERRRLVLERYLTRLSPLADPTVRGTMMCMTDLAVASGIRGAGERTYTTRAWSGARYVPLEAPPSAARDQVVCVALPRVSDYAIVDVVSESDGRERSGPARLHLRIDERGARVLGLERPPSDAPPH